MNLDIFKAYDVRGRVETDLTPEIAERLGSALATWLPTAGAVVVGRDMRPDSKLLSEAFIRGVLQQGRDVCDIGLVTSDMMYFAVGKYKLAGGAMITAGHNDPGFNGFKFCHEEAKPVGAGEGLMTIRDLVARNQFVTMPHKGRVEQKNVLDDWIIHVMSFVDPKKWPKYKVAIDAGNGMAGPVLKLLSQKLPIEVVPLYFDLDPTFPHHSANPLESHTLADLQNTIVTEKCDFGFAFDADGDHAVMVDDDAQSLSGTVLTAILANYVLQKTPGATILYNLICGQIVPETIVKNGGKPYRTRVGFSYIKADMRTNQAVFAGEHTSHFYFKDNFYSDSGLIGVLLSIQAVAESGKKVAELAKPYREAYVSIPEQSFKVQDRLSAIEELRKTFADGDQDLLDGLTVTYQDKWFNVRPSNTEPLLRLNVEAKTLDELTKLERAVEHAIKPFVLRAPGLTGRPGGSQ